MKAAQSISCDLFSRDENIPNYRDIIGPHYVKSVKQKSV